MSIAHKFVRPSRLSASAILGMTTLALTSGLSCLAARIDPTLSTIPADEPIHQAGFPPLPDRIDIQNSGAAWLGSGSNNLSINPSSSQFVLPKPNSAGIIQLPAGVFGAQKNRQPAIQQPDNLTHQLGKEPTLDPRLDKAITAEAPLPVAVTSATTQDLSLPEDEFDPKASKSSSAITRTAQQLGRQMSNSIRTAGSSASSQLTRVIHF